QTRVGHDDEALLSERSLGELVWRARLGHEPERRERAERGREEQRAFASLISRHEQHAARLRPLEHEITLVVGLEIVAGLERHGDAVRSRRKLERIETRLRAATRRNVDRLLRDRLAVEREAHRLPLV